MSDLSYFAFEVTRGGWYISYPDGVRKRHNIHKINENIKKMNLENSNQYILRNNNNFKLGDIKNSSILQKRNII